MEVESDILSVAVGCKGYHGRDSAYGERAWRANGINVDVVYWDVGNGWCDIMAVIPKKGEIEKEIKKFYRKLNSMIDKNYDENGDRIDS
ncbi:MAG: hypothetical protein FJ024_05250 [Chloroflexi bacterium]|nr:hypothetical protein [Chloroflexota bacterium]MBM4451862.1 hypothetical protein [Chloroflexota bacterium]